MFLCLYHQDCAFPTTSFVRRLPKNHLLLYGFNLLDEKISLIAPKTLWRSLSALLITISVSFAIRAEADLNLGSAHLQMGNPSQAALEVGNPSNYLLIKPQYVVSYNRDRGIPNWVSWQLNQNWLGTAKRQGDFRPDATLPSDWYRVRPSDYIGSGFDRGHVVSSEDRGRTIQNNSATFLMTNMLPQAPDSNRAVWANFEEYCRSLVR